MKDWFNIAKKKPTKDGFSFKDLANQYVDDRVGFLKNLGKVAEIFGSLSGQPEITGIGKVATSVGKGIEGTKEILEKDGMEGAGKLGKDLLEKRETLSPETYLNMVENVNKKRVKITPEQYLVA